MVRMKPTEIFLGMQQYSLPVLQQVAKPWTSSSHSQQGAKIIPMFREMLLASCFQNVSLKQSLPTSICLQFQRDAFSL